MHHAMEPPGRPGCLIALGVDAELCGLAAREGQVTPDPSGWLYPTAHRRSSSIRFGFKHHICQFLLLK